MERNKDGLIPGQAVDFETIQRLRREKSERDKQDTGPELEDMKASEVRAYAEEMLGYDPGTKKAAIAALEGMNGDE